jgi:transposase InsO family protein
MAGYDVSKVSKTTLNSHLNRLGVRKEKPYTDQGAYGRFEKKQINKLWQTDTSDGIWLPDPSGTKTVKLTYLVTFIDDCSRLLLHGQYYWSEQLPNLLDCFKKAVTKRGICDKVYSDRGSIFRSRQWKSVCAELGIGQLFAQEASGKGKQERHYLTIQRGFASEAQLSGLQTLEELNEFFDAWIDERYHKEVHKTLKQSPLERWQEEEGTIKRIAPEKLQDALRMRANRQVNFKTALIQLNGREYQASKHLGGEQVQVKWEFDRIDEIEIWREGDFIETARLFVRQEDIDYSKRPEREEGQDKRKYILESSKKYRLAMVSKRRGKAVDSGPNDLLSESEFTLLVEKILARALSEPEHILCKRSYRAGYPLRRDFVETVLERCVKEKGANLHINIYLRRIEENYRNKR